MMMTLGEKIKSARKARGMTQSDLAKNRITRNMLSSIEKGKANPSLETVKYIADTLSLPASYFLSDDDDLFFYEKKEIISDVYRAYNAKNYKACVKKICSISNLDNELSYLLASSYFESAK